MTHRTGRAAPAYRPGPDRPRLRRSAVAAGIAVLTLGLAGQLGTGQRAAAAEARVGSPPARASVHVDRARTDPDEAGARGRRTGTARAAAPAHGTAARHTPSA
ncbi:hypothetical protein ABZ760_28780 [Streptomyces sp. NPDC006658]|uniref:hypothetical protein n=1 Tax=unclassified Streptomyces TaxID=2593676 RepID=UPI0033FD8214